MTSLNWLLLTGSCGVKFSVCLHSAGIGNPVSVGLEMKLSWVDISFSREWRVTCHTLYITVERPWLFWGDIIPGQVCFAARWWREVWFRPVTVSQFNGKVLGDKYCTLYALSGSIRNEVKRIWSHEKNLN